VISNAFADALRLLGQLDRSVLDIVVLSLQVSLSAVAVATLVGLPAGALVAVARFPGRPAVVTLLNSMMGLPSVVVGIVVYLLLSRSGPFGGLGLLFTPKAMVVAQTILATPLVAAFTRQLVEDAWKEYGEMLRSLRLGLRARVGWLLWDCRFALVVAVLAGLGRAISEVGAVMIVGGNIDRVTRTMTTAIALETSKGDLALALSLGIVLVLLVVGLNGVAAATRAVAMRRYG
jgi:tungstate transport system permease protein